MTHLVGIINLTTDSFSDGGKISSTEQAVRYAQQLVEEGADVVDIGAESTRPGAMPLTPAEEWQRLEAPLSAIIRTVGSKALISVDTRHAATASKALILGAHWINDVSGLGAAMLEVLAKSDCKIVAMHSLSVPADPANVLPEGSDPVKAVLEFVVALRGRLDAAGIASERVILDPGIGFGKTGAQSLELLRRVDELKACGFALLIGHSRKSFLREFTGGKPELRDAATLAVSLMLAKRHVDFLRVHAIGLHKAALNVAENL